ncbi:CAP-Gly domain-containing linker protein 1-like [Cyprinodon tularosa]|uniref:CAP-Gly domain-containing linker protein 1-like n=1 Tax=Cyprinodon tularosa TaxID=77115 RepID=UPI0018E24EC8|nr:CAP-Gly domain-containing linker protein 1-like [Cyprinodon tularosa]
MSNQTRRFQPRGQYVQESGRRNQYNQGAWVQGRNPPPGHYFDAETNRLLHLLDVERKAVKEEQRKVNYLAKELQDTKNQLQNQKNQTAAWELKVEHGRTLISTLRDQNKTLQNELEQLKTSSQETISKNETEILMLRQQAEKLEQELTREGENNSKKAENEFQAKEAKVHESLELKTENMLANLQRELETVKASHREMTEKYEKDTATLKQRAETLKQELMEEMERHSKTSMTNIQMFNNLTAKNKALRQEMAEKMARLEQSAEETETRLQRQLQEVTLSDKEVIRKYEVEVSLLKIELDSLKQQLNANNQRTSNKMTEMEVLNKSMFETMDKMLESLEQTPEDPAAGFQEEVDRIRASQQEAIRKYQQDNLTLREQTETLKQELDEEREAHSQTLASNLQVINGLAAENEALRQEMAQKISGLQEEFKATETLKQRELEEERVSHQEIVSEKEREVLHLKRKLERLETLLNDEADTSVKKSAEDLDLINQLRAERDELQQEISALKQTSINEEISQDSILQLTEEEVPEKRKKSPWKRFRHSLGLRKPEQFKRNKSTSEERA